MSMHQPVPPASRPGQLSALRVSVVVLLLALYLAVLALVVSVVCAA